MNLDIDLRKLITFEDFLEDCAASLSLQKDKDSEMYVVRESRIDELHNLISQVSTYFKLQHPSSPQCIVKIENVDELSAGYNVRYDFHFGNAKISITNSTFINVFFMEYMHFSFSSYSTVVDRGLKGALKILMDNPKLILISVKPSEPSSFLSELIVGRNDQEELASQGAPLIHEDMGSCFIKAYDELNTHYVS